MYRESKAIVLNMGKEKGHKEQYIYTSLELVKWYKHSYLYDYTIIKMCVHVWCMCVCVCDASLCVWCTWVELRGQHSVFVFTFHLVWKWVSLLFTTVYPRLASWSPAPGNSPDSTPNLPWDCRCALMHPTSGKFWWLKLRFSWTSPPWSSPQLCEKKNRKLNMLYEEQESKYSR